MQFAEKAADNLRQTHHFSFDRHEAHEDGVGSLGRQNPQRIQHGERTARIEAGGSQLDGVKDGT